MKKGNVEVNEKRRGQLEKGELMMITSALAAVLSLTNFGQLVAVWSSSVSE